MDSIKLILASASPRRRELLAGLGKPFDIIVPVVDETPWPGEAPASFAMRMAHEKAMAVIGYQAAEGPVLIVAADTIVVLNGNILGKPVDAEHARFMLRNLSGNRHTVITGLCVMHCRNDTHTFHGEAVRTQVQFKEVDGEEIDRYVAGGEPMDKAGAYAIQGGAAGMVDHIEGSYTNVIGLPMESLTRLLGHAS